MNNLLSMEEVERRIAISDSGGPQTYSMALYRQLLESMRENKTLKEALKACVTYLEWEADKKIKVNGEHFFKHAATLLPAQELLQRTRGSS